MFAKAKEFSIIERPAGRIEIYRKCTVTNKVYSVCVSEHKYKRWKTGNELIQNVFPELDADQREFLMTGTTPAEWDKMFGGGDE